MSKSKHSYNHRFNDQRGRALRRGIGWYFTFDEWLAWWGDDIIYRGSGKNDLVMARTNDTGPYHPNNVRKATFSENSIERNSRYYKETHTPDGVFESFKAACEYYNMSAPGFKKRMKNHSELYYFAEGKK